MALLPDGFDSVDKFVDYVVKRIEGYQIMGKYVTQDYGVCPESPTGFAEAVEEQITPVLPIEWIRFCATEIKKDLSKDNTSPMKEVIECCKETYEIKGCPHAILLKTECISCDSEKEIFLCLSSWITERTTYFPCIGETNRWVNNNARK